MSETLKLSDDEQSEALELAFFVCSDAKLLKEFADHADLSGAHLAKLAKRIKQLCNPPLREVTINHEQRLYVIPCGPRGFTRHGFENLRDETNAMAKAIGKPGLDEDELGTMAAYTYHEKIVREFATHPASKDTWFAPGTPEAVQTALEQYRKSRKPIRVFLGDVVTGRSWMDEHDVIGEVGRSMGPIRVPLLVPKGEDGGGAILTACIIRLVDVQTSVVLYSHPEFHVPALEVRSTSTASPEALDAGLLFEVVADGDVHARFHTLRQAHDYVAFIKGDRMRLPTRENK